MSIQDIIAQTETHYRQTFERIFPKRTDFRKLAEELLSEKKAQEELVHLSETLQTRLSGKKILEIGSGYGMVLVTGRKIFAAEMFGVEPGEQFKGAFSVCQNLLKENNLSPSIVKKGVGENIPYDDAVFDIVYSSNVLEHVEDPEKVIAESIRVLKPGGVLVFVIPNYGSWWEGHYGLFMIPHSPRWVISIMVRMLGRDSSFVRTLKFVTFGKLVHWLKPIKDQIAVVETGQLLWEKRIRSMVFSEWALLSKVKVAVRLIHRLGLTDILITIGKRLHWETPFVLVLKKIP